MGSEKSIQHVAIIMDGNGRWAKERFRPRVWGHVRGSGVVADIVEQADELGVKALTLYAFSTENWSRPETEIKTLFKLLRKFLLKEFERVVQNNIQFRVLGDTCGLPGETLKLIDQLESTTSENTGLHLNFCFGYGGRQEILNSCNRWISENPGKSIEMDDLERHLLTSNCGGDVDLLIRTGGDQRVSNFLLWQLAYAELYFTPIKWPDFTTDHLKEIIDEVSGRERRFGAIDPGQSLRNVSQTAQGQKEKFNQVHRQ